MSDVVVIGAGLAGLTAALRLARAGKSVTLTTKGPGGLQLSQGTVDILGYTPERVTAPLDAVAAVSSEHPYASIGADAVAKAPSARSCVNTGSATRCARSTGRPPRGCAG